MTLKVGIVGTGWFSRKHAGILRNLEEAALQAVCGTSRKKAEAMAADFEGVKGYGELEEMLAAEELDAVYICVPPMSHGKIEMQLIARGIPFFVEKPLGVDLETPKKILKKVKAAGLITSAGYHFRYSPSTEALKKELEKTTVGLISGRWMGEMPEVSWWRKQDRSGGQFIEQTTHLADLLRYLAGEVEEVYAVYGSRVMHKKYEGVTVPDVGTVTLRMQNGVAVSMNNTCILPPGTGEIEMSFYTEDGILAWEPEKLQQTNVSGTSELPLTEEDPYIKESRAFLQAVKTGDDSGILSTYEDAYQTQKITYAAYLSAEQREPVKPALL